MSSAKPKKPIKRMMAENSEKTKKDFTFEHQYLRNIGGLTIELFTLIEKSTIKSNREFAVLTLAVKNFRHLQCVGDHIFDGYYEVAMSILRTVYENILLMEYLEGNEKEAKKWLKGKEFKPKFIRDKLGQNNEIYKFFSSYFVHTNVDTVSTIIKIFKNKIIDLDYYPTYKKKFCETCLHFFITSSWANVIFLQYTFRDFLWKRKKWKKNFADWNEVFIKYVDEKIIKKRKVKFEFKEKLPNGF